VTKIGLSGTLLFVLGAAFAFAQTGGSRSGGPLIRHQAPTDKALDFSLKTLQAEFADMKAQKRPTTRLLEGGAYSLNARYQDGAEAPRIHKSIIEFYFVQDGAGTLVTGGSIVGDVIRGGVERTVKAGDVIFIAPGVPHAFSAAKALSYLNIHFGGTD
jgi:hypothetical protein